jgi:hypothetical protein
MKLISQVCEARIGEALPYVTTAMSCTIFFRSNYIWLITRPLTELPAHSQYSTDGHIHSYSPTHVQPPCNRCSMVQENYTTLKHRSKVVHVD